MALPSIGAAFAAVVVVFVVTGCAPIPAVAVAGAPYATAEIRGTWTGTIRNDRDGDAGSLRITLGDSATGDVLFARHATDVGTLMMNQMTTRTPGARGGVTTRSPTPVASLAGLEVRNGSIRGWFEPTIDPLCGCLVQVVFAGIVTGDTMSGTLVSFVMDRPMDRAFGTWTATREPARTEGSP